jgi:hypothetical protein
MSMERESLLENVPPRSVSKSHGDFAWCVNGLDLGDPDLNRIVRGVCRTVVVWPEQLLGFDFAAERDGAVKGVHPLSTGPCPDRSNVGHVAFARHWIWHIAYHDTDLHPADVAAMMGFSASVVWSWGSPEKWRKVEGNEWFVRHYKRLLREMREAIEHA